MAKSYSVGEALDLLPLLTELFINLGGDISLFLKRRSVWLYSKVGAVAATAANPSGSIIEPTKDYFLDLAALAAEVEELLVERAENHWAAPVEPLSHIPHAKSSI
jgi:hypothetical protein